MIAAAGLAFVAMSDRAWQRAAETNLPRYISICSRFAANLSKMTIPTPYPPRWWSPCVRRSDPSCGRTRPHLSRHRQLAEATRAGIKALGLSLLAEKSPSDALTVIRVPAGIDGARIPKLFQDLCNITIVGGQDRLRGQSIPAGAYGLRRYL